jgi:hypothetical protein
MNPEWPTLNTYAHHHGLRPTQFVPNYQPPLDRYLTPDSRDFFAIYRRLPGRRARAISMIVLPLVHGHPLLRPDR